MRHRARMPAVPTSAPSLARGTASPSAGRISWPSDCRRPARASKSPVLERSRQRRTRRARPRGRGRRGRASDHYAKKRRERTRRLVHLAAASRAGGLALALFGLLLRVLLAPEDDLAVLRVHEDRVALLELAREDLLRERVDHQALDRPFDRTRSVDRIESFFCDQRLRVVGEVARDLSLRKPLGEDLRLLLDDLHELRSHEVLEDDDLVDAVQELGPELTAERVHDALAEEVLLVGELGDERRPDVARHDDDDVLEVDCATVPIGETPVVEDL